MIYNPTLKIATDLQLERYRRLAEHSARASQAAAIRDRLPVLISILNFALQSKTIGPRIRPRHAGSRAAFSLYRSAGLLGRLP
ncbi:hypothetical protein QRX60_45410 [Amycolatopsis mongoliensis]|uniref:Uncharacterized protein n=1 Tax=Amycolatopsis mongoliensis TaxID=715475 RepID=A0A9Y2NGV0_9PSEU|nr:hypothetical protein [Amycolatopsis sp. 4-36]WIY01199.1 hypothetical protein QRX60_45410 [Amycolatopsis sp. 4-36]